MFPQIKSLKNKGFTIIEVLVVIFILSLLLVSLFQVMSRSYEIFGTEKQKTTMRSEFRIFSSFLLEDLLFASSVHVQNEPTYDVLSYISISGKQQTVYFDDKLGISLLEDGERVQIADGERYEPKESMVRMDEDGVIRFNFYARSINTLFLTSVKPRTTLGGTES